MYAVTVEPLTREGFAPFGTFVDLMQVGMENGQEVFQSGFFPNLMPLTTAQPTAVSLGRVCACEPVVPFLESHLSSAEARLPLDGDIVVYVAPRQPLEQFDPATMRAFLVPKGTLIELAPGVVHGRQFTTGQPVVRVMILCGEDAWEEGSEVRRLGGELEIVLITK